MIIEYQNWNCDLWNIKKCCLWHALQCCECHRWNCDLWKIKKSVVCGTSYSVAIVTQVALWAALRRILRIVTAKLFVPAHAYNASCDTQAAPTCVIHLGDTLVWYTGNPSTRSQFIPRGRCRCPRPQIVPRDQITGLALNGEKEKLTLEATRPDRLDFGKSLPPAGMDKSRKMLEMPVMIWAQVPLARGVYRFYRGGCMKPRVGMDVPSRWC